MYVIPSLCALNNEVSGLKKIGDVPSAWTYGIQIERELSLHVTVVKGFT